MKEILDSQDRRSFTLTSLEWTEVCDSINLDTVICTMLGRCQALIRAAEDKYGAGWCWPPEDINFRLRKRQRRAGFTNPCFEIVNGRKIGIRDSK